MKIMLKVAQLKSEVEFFMELILLGPSWNRHGVLVTEMTRARIACSNSFRSWGHQRGANSAQRLYATTVLELCPTSDVYVQAKRGRWRQKRLHESRRYQKFFFQLHEKIPCSNADQGEVLNADHFAFLDADHGQALDADQVKVLGADRVQALDADQA